MYNRLRSRKRYAGGFARLALRAARFLVRAPRRLAFRKIYRRRRRY